MRYSHRSWLIVYARNSHIPALGLLTLYTDVLIMIVYGAKSRNSNSNYCCRSVDIDDNLGLIE